ncbi:protein transport protein sec39 [Rhypophila decipiens]
MALLLSPPKLVLLAVQLAVKADVECLAALAAHHGAILRKELLLRIVLTYLPEALHSSEYVGFLEQLERGAFPEKETKDIDITAIASLSEDEARKRVKKLRLLPLTFPGDAGEAAKDVTTQFLLCRAYRVDEEAGLLNELPALLTPFLDHNPCIRTLTVSTLLPLLRRNCAYHTERPISYTLHGFQQLPDEVAVNLLLSQTGSREEDLPFVGRDLRGLIGPWLLNEKRWKGRQLKPAPGTESETGLCPGWEHVLTWLTGQASKSWRVAVNAIEQWEGPNDIDSGGLAEDWLIDEELNYLKHTYARAALASTYLISDISDEALEGAYGIVAKTSLLLDQDPLSPLHTAAGMLPPLAEQISDELAMPRNATCMRNDLLSSSNVLTAPLPSSLVFIQALILSAFIMTKSACPISVRRAGDLALLQDEREQKSEAAKLIHDLMNGNNKTDDRFWLKMRNEVLWLRDWGAEDESVSPDAPGRGIFGQVKREFLEMEILKALLANNRFTLARSIYEDPPTPPISKKVLQDTIFSTAQTAYDNASNPNRTRGGLKKCDDIIKAFPKTVEKALPATKRIEALLRATHALSEYRLVLKQGEPFTPVVLRVHPDPVSIVGKILEQNPKSYTRIQDLLDLGTQMVKAGLTHKQKYNLRYSPEEEQQKESEELDLVERRITALSIDAALTEDDFETAYSYVVNRVSAMKPSLSDEFSWKAALQAGKYRRTSRTLRPTHLGTSSANVEIRHLEQRIECLATALRIAPPATLQEILNAFRRAEEELDAAIKAEDEQEDAWDAQGDILGGQGNMPGTFGGGEKKTRSGGQGAARYGGDGAGGHSSGGRGESFARRHQEKEEAPMSLFDLSRASVLSAQKNLSALSSLHRTVSSVSSSVQSQSQEGGRVSLDQSSIASVGSDGEEQQPKQQRARKRDQLREAAMGTLVSGVGWLINAPAPPQGRD